MAVHGQEEYKCLYCGNNAVKDFKQIVDHNIIHHPKEDLAFQNSFVTLAKPQTRMIDFKVKPQTYLDRGQLIIPLEGQKIRISNRSEPDKPFQFPKKSRYQSTPIRQKDKTFQETEEIEPSCEKQDITCRRRLDETLGEGSNLLVSTDVADFSYDELEIFEESFQNMSLTERELVDNKECQTDLSISSYLGDEGVFNELIAMIPRVVDTLKENNQLDGYLKFNRLLMNKQLPMKNIAFLLFMDIVEWYGTADIRQMRYSEEVLKFWTVGHTLFKGRFLRYMGGWKNQSLPPQRSLKPEESSINFAVPDRKCFSHSKEFKDLKPGIIHEMIDLLQKDDPFKVQTYKLCVDGKKLNVGVRNQKIGDINLWGHEGPPSLNTMEERLSTDLETIRRLENVLWQIEARDIAVLTDIPDYLRKEFTETSRSIILNMSERLKDLRSLRVGKQMTLEKLKKNCTTEQLKNKYSYAISSIKTYLYQIDVCVGSLVRLVDQLSFYTADLNNVRMLFCNGPICDLSTQANYMCLTGIGSSLSEGTLENVQFSIIKQQSDVWRQARETARVTGSTLHKALGLSGLKQQQQHYEKVFLGTAPTFTSAEKERMQYGSDNEINAVATLVSKVFPVFCPEVKYVEEGCYATKRNGQTFLVVSPDGSGRVPCGESIELDTVCGIEIKCPFPGKTFTTPVYYKLPSYYVIQVLSEMSALKTDSLIFLCYSKDTTSVFKVRFNDDLWQCILEKASELYDGESSYPKKRLPELKELVDRLTKYCDENVEFLAEVKSVEAKKCDHKTTSDDMKEIGHNSHQCTKEKSCPSLVDSVCKVTYEIKKTTNESYSLCRRMASEVLVFLISDLDRIHKHERQHSVPIGYAMKGYSMCTNVMRKMVEEVLDTCFKQGLYVPVISYDGQWFNMAVRSRTNEPLTILQLSKDVYKEVKKLSKTHLFKEITKANVVDIDSHEDLKNKIEYFIQRNHTGNIIAPITVNGVTTGNPPIIFSRNAYLMMTEKSSKRNENEQRTELNNCLLEQNDCIIDSLTPEVLETLDDNILGNMRSSDLRTEKAMFDTDIDLSYELPQLFSNRDDDASEVIVSEIQEMDVDLDQQRSSEVTMEDKTSEDESLRTPSFSVTDEILNEILRGFVNGEQSSRVSKWKNMSIHDFKSVFESKDRMKKSCSKKELLICLKYLKTVFDQVSFTQSWNKNKIVDMIEMALIRPAELGENRGRTAKRKKSVLSLRTMCAQKVKKYSKEMLNVIYAENIFPQRLQLWRNSSLFADGTLIKGLDRKERWYSKPEYIPERFGYTFHLLDCHHLLTNALVKCCSSGMKEVGIKKEAWLKVAKDNINNGSGLNLALVEDLIDKQSNAYALKTFSAEVERIMERNGDMVEAKFCKLLREWYQAEDDPGLTAVERCRRRLSLRDWLLQSAQIGTFPPAGTHIKGIPLVMFEGILTNIDRRIQLYSFVKKGTYNVRAVGSLEAENLFGNFQDLDPSGSGIMRPDDIPSAISSACELTNARLDPDRVFYMHTSRAKVYPTHELIHKSEVVSDPVFLNPEAVSIISPRSHVFDLPERGCRKQKRKRGEISKPDAPSRGARPVREHHRVDEKNILPEKRMGIEISQL